MIPYFTPPEAYTSLVFQHPDLAPRDVLFDENDFTKITGVVDWGGAQILPLILTAHFLGDLLSTGNDPGEHSDEPVDLSPIGATMIKRYYLRQYFGAFFSRHMTELHGNTDLSYAIVFKDATYYLKFHEVIMSGNDDWFLHEKWIRETFNRLKIVGTPAGKLLLGLKCISGVR
ncbi:hypothetical protein M422DRAFT_260781 [Sphaerobolus stellatus SS14]|uniref:Aminoglycoside phosphotransferase domain-containing protein n=1 Tax=Sphaerobolus stellatus (strain SS14) TaxID=990650 RepID=A0A0C9V4P9_SPHS4|nr:hypothetical protein M422DRAFT_260781 [Sphaerobolus stellatus SS14]